MGAGLCDTEEAEQEEAREGIETKSDLSAYPASLDAIYSGFVIQVLAWIIISHYSSHILFPMPSAICFLRNHNEQQPASATEGVSDAFRYSF